jgi:segregation and condensation protein A
MDDYKVRLPDFHGPLDLLLHLVKRNEVDVRDIPIALIADQFRQYLDVLRVIDVEAAGDFLVMAAMLLEIKSRMVLARPEDQRSADEPADDPRRELVKQLLEYKRYRDAAARLETHALARQRQMPRGEFDEMLAQAHRTMQTPELWDLVSAFGRIVQETAALEPEQVVTDDTPQQAYVEQVLAAVHGQPSTPFRCVFTAPYYRLRLIGLFLAVLELIKSQKIAFEYDEASGEIILKAFVSD